MAKQNRFYGCHVSSSGGLHNALSNGNSLSINTIQIHPSPPQRWNLKPFAPGVERQFLEMRESVSVKRVFFHGIYLINLANPDPVQSQNSRLSLLHDLDLCARIGGDGVIFHVGSMKHSESEEAGYALAAKTINWVMENSKNDARLLLEVAAGSGSVIGDRVEELKAIYDQVRFKDRVGFALDTQHLWASGYDLRNSLEEIVENVDEVLTLKKVWAVHLNDSKTALGSRTDRHENIGDGLIGSDALKRFFLHEKLAPIPFILETPSMKSLETAAPEVEKLRQFLA